MPSPAHYRSAVGHHCPLVLTNTAAIAFGDVVAHGILAGLAGLAGCGVRVPVDFSVTGCDDVLAVTTGPVNHEPHG